MDILPILREFGFPTVVSSVLLVGLWKICYWLRSDFFTPLKNSHLRLVGQLQKSDESHVDTHSRNAVTLEVIAKTQERQADTQDRQAQTLDRMVTNQETQTEKIEQLVAGIGGK